ncbi:MAG: FxsA family protein [Nitrospirota bacterium]|jgi:UPF0716 protein FxsA
MLFRLFVLFCTIPVVELALLVYVGSRIGVLETIAIVVFTGVSGAFLVRSEGLGVLRRFRENVQRGVFPSEEILDGSMVLVAGALLLTPGFLTDILGFLLVFPPSRKRIKRFVRRYIDRHFMEFRIR